MGKEIVNQVQEAHRVPYRKNPRRNTPKHILIKLSKIEYKKILKAVREKQQITHKGIPIKLTADHSAETLKARREWQDIFKVIKGKKPTTKITLPSKDLIQIQRRNENLYSQEKVKRIQQYQTSFATNAKGTFLGRKHKRRKRPTIRNPK